MVIEQIELLNFGSYEGLNKFNITTNSVKERIVVIGGKNGAGKTTFFTAIQTCLYGHLAFGYKSAGKLYFKQIYNLINDKARIDESQSAYLKICFSENKREREQYIVTRSWNWDNGYIEECLTVEQNGEELNEEQLNNFENYLIHLIPPDLLKLYFFDGEKIADFFLDEQHNNIKNALMILSGNDTYEVLYNSVRRLLNGVESGNENIAQNYADQKEALSEYIKIKHDLYNEIATLNQEEERLDVEISKTQKLYSVGGGVSLEEWKALQQKLRNEEEHREKLNWERKNAANDILPFIIVQNLLKKSRLQIQKENDIRTRSVLQSALKSIEFKKYLKQITQKTSCQNIEKDTALLYKSISDFFSDPGENKNYEIFKMSEDEIAGVLSTISTIENYECSKFGEYKSDIDESVQRSKKIRKKLQISSIDNLAEHTKVISTLFFEINKVRFIKEQQQIKLNELQEKIQLLYDITEKTKKELEAELTKNSITSLSDKMLLLVGELQERLYNQLIQKVENDINFKFQELIRKKEFIDHIYFDENFYMHLVRIQPIESSIIKSIANKRGRAGLKNDLKEAAYYSLIEQLCTTEEDLIEALSKVQNITIILPMEVAKETLSNGEKQILVMSLYWAIMNQSQNPLPFIIDTPFARIDTQHRSNITNRFFKELSGQLFILSTNEEVRNEHLSELEGQIAKTFMLEYGESKRTHIYEDGYFGGKYGI